MADWNASELAFIAHYGSTHLASLVAFIENQQIVHLYHLARNDPNDLFIFGLHYGLIRMVAFCYCHLGIELNFSTVFDGYKDRAKDPFTADRNECIRYLLSLKKYSKYRLTPTHDFIYHLDPKYLATPNLLEPPLVPSELI